MSLAILLSLLGARSASDCWMNTTRSASRAPKPISLSNLVKIFNKIDEQLILIPDHQLDHPRRQLESSREVDDGAALLPDKVC